VQAHSGGDYIILTKLHNLKVAAGLAVFALTVAPVLAQDRDRDRDWDAQQGKYTRIPPGTVVPIRMNQTITWIGRTIAFTTGPSTRK